jgi:hypothetical protein
MEPNNQKMENEIPKDKAKGFNNETKVNQGMCDN